VRGPWADGTTLAADLARYHPDLTAGHGEVDGQSLVR
jgi:hypothetical protein